MSVRHGLHHLRCDRSSTVALKHLLICFEIKFGHVMHDACLATHNHVPSSIFMPKLANEKYRGCQKSM